MDRYSESPRRRQQQLPPRRENFYSVIEEDEEETDPRCSAKNEEADLSRKQVSFVDQLELLDDTWARRRKELQQEGLFQPRRPDTLLRNFDPLMNEGIQHSGGFSESQGQFRLTTQRFYLKTQCV